MFQLTCIPGKYNGFTVASPKRKGTINNKGFHLSLLFDEHKAPKNTKI